MESAIIGSILSAMATGAGALPILLIKNVTHRWRDILLAFTAGIMMAASTFSLIPQALALSNLMIITIGLLVGTFVLNYMEKHIPHVDLEHTKYNLKLEQKAVLIITAITLHNIPEGLSVGVSYASGDQGLGGLIAFAIGLQNAPEGFLVALFLVNQRISKGMAILVATLTGAVEIVTGIIGYALSAFVDGLVPYGLSFAAGAMLFIIYKELIPESHGDGNERFATYAFIIGLITMLYMVHIFG